MELSDAILQRRSTKSYDPDRAVGDETLRELFELVLKSPSSFNLQHWRFVVVRDADRRKQLMAASWGQPHVGQAPVDIIVCAKLNAHEHARAGNSHAPEDVLAKLVPMIDGIYANNPQLRRDEAIRSGAIASMTLMLVAESMGLRSCPMIGFDPQKVGAIVGLDEGTIPVMLITLGYPGEGGVFPTSRFPMADVVKLEALDGEGLGA